MITLIFLIVVAFVFFAFFAGSEMAYLSCNKLKLKHLAGEGDRRAQVILRFHQHPNRFLTNILIGTNLMHVTVTGLVTYLLEERLNFRHEWITVSVLSFLIIVFAETIPKDWFRHKADDFIYRFAYILHFLDRMFSIVSQLLIKLTDFLLEVSASNVKRSPYVTREEFRYVIEESVKKGVLHDHERQLIDTILNLSSRRVEEVMTTVSRFPKLPLTGKVKDIKDIARKIRTEAVLIYEEIPSIVVGIIYVFDVLFEEDENQSLARFLKAPLFMSHDTTVEKAIFLLQSRHASFGAVINSDREVIGVTSLENLLQFN